LAIEFRFSNYADRKIQRFNPTSKRGLIIDQIDRRATCSDSKGLEGNECELKSLERPFESLDKARAAKTSIENRSMFLLWALLPHPDQRQSQTMVKSPLLTIHDRLFVIGVVESSGEGEVLRLESIVCGVACLDSKGLSARSIDRDEGRRNLWLRILDRLGLGLDS
jgi:hypothetical protein